MKKFSILLAFLLPFLLVGCNSTATNNSNNSLDNAITVTTPTTLPDQLKTNPNEPKYDPIKIVFLGNSNTVKSIDHVTVINKQFGDTIDKDIRFVLVDFNETIDKNKEKYLDQLVNDKKVVIFIGYEIDPNKTKEKLGLDFPIVSVNTNADVQFYMYGFGYSSSQKKNIPIFFYSNTGSNTYIEDSLNFLLEANAKF